MKIIGINKIIYIQTKLNAKRKKRKSKGNYKVHKNILPQIIHIFKTGKLLKNTHYKEIDPYWGVLWRQYEYLRYIEIYIKLIINKEIEKNNLNNEIIEDYISLLTKIRSHLNNMMKWMFNAFFIQIGGVINSRFFGWKKYIDRFVETFYEIAIENINKLRFDINKTRCSVYFYQAFWLAGLAIVNQIQQDKQKEKQIEDNLNRGTKIYSTHNNENTNNKLEEEIIELNELDKIKTYNHIENELDKDDEIKDKAIEVIRNIMNKANIPLNIFYNNDNRNKDKIINALANRIKKKIKKNKIKLTEEEYSILRNYLGIKNLL